MCGTKEKSSDDYGAQSSRHRRKNKRHDLLQLKVGGGNSQKKDQGAKGIHSIASEGRWDSGRVNSVRKNKSGLQETGTGTTGACARKNGINKGSKKRDHTRKGGGEWEEMVQF